MSASILCNHLPLFGPGTQIYQAVIDSYCLEEVQHNIKGVYTVPENMRCVSRDIERQVVVILSMFGANTTTEYCVVYGDAYLAQEPQLAGEELDAKYTIIKQEVIF